MKSMLIKYNDTQAIPMSSENKGYFPTLEISSKSIPALMDKKVGDTCELKIKVKVTGLREDDRGSFANVEVLEGEYYEDKE